MSDASADLRSHFGLSAMPFTREIAVSDRWCSPIFDEPLADLRSTLEQRMSAVLIAPSGTGKTVLLRTVKDSLPEARYQVRVVKVTSLAKRDMYREIAAVTGVETGGTYATLLRALQDRFQHQADDEGLRPVLLVDEAHDMRPDVLATLRVLTNFDMDSRLVLSVLLAGTTQLAKVLGRAELAPISSRMAHYATLRLLSRAETTDYAKHRLHIAGARTIPFDDHALDAVFEITRGNLRAIDHLCRKSLEIATKKNVKTVDSTIVVAARKLLPP
jgi:general secretion pathway protein A